MRRRAVGRNIGLSVRMALVFACVMLVYAAVVGVAVGSGVEAIHNGRWGSVLAWLFLLACVSFVLYLHVTRGGEAALRAARAKTVRDPEEPELRELLRLVARVAAQADLPTPRVALIHSWSPNAFSVGSSPRRAVVAVTTELLRRLNASELEAVVAHELSHVSNRDGAVMGFAAGPVCACSVLWNERKDNLTAYFAIIFVLPLWVYSLVVLRMLSRYREFAADRGAAVITGAPEQLMSALVAVAGRPARGDLRGGSALEALCLVSFRNTDWVTAAFGSDHPPLEKRLAALEEIAREMGRSTPS